MKIPSKWQLYLLTRQLLITYESGAVYFAHARRRCLQACASEKVSSSMCKIWRKGVFEHAQNMAKRCLRACAKYGEKVSSSMRKYGEKVSSSMRKIWRKGVFEHTQNMAKRCLRACAKYGEKVSSSMRKIWRKGVFELAQIWRKGVFEHAQNTQLQIHPKNAQSFIWAFALFLHSFVSNDSVSRPSPLDKLTV